MRDRARSSLSSLLADRSRRLGGLTLLLAALAVVMFLTMGGQAWAAQDSAAVQPQSESPSNGGLGLEVTATRLRVVEGGSAAAYTIHPGTDPGQTLNITIGNPDTTAFTVSPTTLSFTHGSSGNWQTAQQVTITPLQDADSDHEVVSLTHTATGVADPDVQVYVSDDDATDPPPVPDDAGGYYGSLAQASKALVKVNEGQFEHIDTYTLHLTSDPGQDVTLTVNNPAPDQLTISPTSLTFTAGGAGNWNHPQTVTVTGQSDSDNRNDGLYPLYFIHSSGAFVGPPVMVHTRDLNGVGDNTVVYGMEYIYVTERGATATYSVRMAGAPANYLRVNISSTIPKSVTVEPTTVDFDQTNWDDPQFITITARDDLDSISQQGLITHRYQEASHTDWDSVTMFVDGKSLPVTTTDGWSADPIFEQNSHPIANILTYDGKEPTYTVRLANDPGQDITLDLQHDARVTTYPQRLSFTGGSSGDWATPQTVTLHVGLDSDTDNEEIAINHLYEGFIEATLPVTIIDSDPKSMIVYVYPSTSTMNEGETAQCYFVALADDPSGEVTMTLTSSMPGSLTISPSTLTFDSDNYREMQPITLTAVEDINANDETVAILHDLPGYRQVTLNIDITDNDPGGIVITPRNELTLWEATSIHYDSTPRVSVHPRLYSYYVHLARDPGIGKTVVVERSGNATDGVTFYGGGSYGRLTFTGGPDGTWDLPQKYDLGSDRDYDHVDNTFVATHTTTIDGFTSSTDVILHVVEADPTIRPRPRPVAYTGADMIVEFPEPIVCEDDEECEDPDPIPFPVPTVAPSRLHIVEEGPARSYSVFFKEDPITNFTITISTESANATPASWLVSPLTLNFTGGENGNWQTPQWVTVSGIADSDTDDDQLTILHQADGHHRFGGTVIAHLYDDDTDGVAISDTALALNEGATTTYTVSLASDPGGSATVTPTSTDITSVTFTPASLMFTTSDWMNPQTVTVQAEQDADGDHETVTISHAVSGYTTAAPPEGVTVTVTDDEAPTVSVTAGGGVTEGTAATFTISTTPTQTSATSVSITVAQSGEYVAAADLGMKTVSIPISGALTYTVDTTSDEQDEPDGEITITVNASDAYTVSGTPGTATVTVSDDDDPPECTVQLPSDAITVAEVQGWRDEYSAAAHVQRWNRVLAALGESTGESAMTPAESREIKSRINNSRWDRTTRTLEAMAKCDTPTPAKPELSISAGSDVSEGSDATFTITADPPPTGTLLVWLSITEVGDYDVDPDGVHSINMTTSGSYTLTLGTTGDHVDEANGSVKVAISARAMYTVSVTAGSATVAIADDDVPEISITRLADITEGANAMFTLTANPTPATPLAVEVEVTQSADFGAATGPHTVTIPTSGSKTFQVATNDDRADDPDGTVSVAVSVGAGYTVSAGSGSADVNVADNDPPAGIPVISIVAGSDIQEGADATFTITATPPPSTNVDVTVTVTQTGAFVATPGSQTITMTSTGTYTLTVGITNDDVYEQDGSVTVTVDPDTAYAVLPTDGSATVQVSDDEKSNPCVQVVTENGTIKDQWTSSCQSHQRYGRYSQFYTFEVSQQSKTTFDLVSSTDTFLYLRAGQGTDRGTSVEFNDDGGGRQNARISRLLDAGWYTVEATTYGRPGPGGKFQLTIGGLPPAASQTSLKGQKAQTTEPEITIAAGSDVTEGSDATFTITASPTPAADLDVTIAVTQSGDYVTTGSRTVTIPTSGSQTLTISTTNDSDDEPDGSVTATISSGTGYTVSQTSAAATVAIADDDTCSPTLPADAVTISEVTGWRDALSNGAGINRFNRVLATLGVDTGETPMSAEQAQQVADWLGNTRWDRIARTLAAMEQSQCDTPPPSEPEISITAGSGITEGSNASFTVSATPNPTSALTVNLTISQSGNFGATTGSRTVIIPTTGSKTFTVSTTNDSTDEPDGSVTATLASGTGYTVSGTSNAATVAVSDDDDPPIITPVISIAAGSGITEGGNASFTVTASPNPTSALTVKVTISQSGSFGVTTGSRTITIPTTGSLTFTVSTTNDSNDELDGSVTATLATGTGYTVSGTSNAATVAVSDDDDPPAATPIISIAAGSSITEGADASFTVTASPTPTSALTVNVTISQSGNFVSTGSRTITIPTSGSRTITVRTTNDSTDEPDGSVSATVTTGAGYTVSTNDSVATVAVSDDDDPPPVTPSSGPPTVTVSDASASEGDGHLIFTIILSHANAKTIKFRYGAFDRSATMGQDFNHEYREFTLNAGDTTLDIDVPIIDDNEVEGDETFNFYAYATSGITLSPYFIYAEGTITDDD